MANTTIHWEMRGIMAHLRDEGRLSVLLAYVLHANTRNRAWPSVDALCKETGWARASVVKAKAWLVEHGALERVPYEMRLEDERRHPRIDVMQITGTLKLDGKAVPFLYFNERTNESEEDANSSPSESSPSISSPSEPEGIALIKDTTTTKGKSGGGSERGLPKKDGSTKEPKPPAPDGEQTIFALYDDNIAKLTPIIAESLGEFVDSYGEAAVREAISLAVKANARNLRYIEGVLRKKAGQPTRKEVRATAELVKLNEAAAAPLPAPEPEPVHAPPEHMETWKKTLAALQAALPEATYRQHVAPARLVSLRDHDAEVTVPGSNRAWLQDKLASRFARALGDASGGGIVRVLFVDSNGAAADVAAKWRELLELSAGEPEPLPRHLKGCRLVAADGARAVVIVPDVASRVWLEQKAVGILLKWLQRVFGRPFEVVTFITDGQPVPPAAARAVAA